MRSIPGNPYDGHTLAETHWSRWASSRVPTEGRRARYIVDKGYRGVEVEGVRILRSGQSGASPGR